MSDSENGFSDSASTSAPDSGFKASPNAVQHNPRKRASGPGFNPRDMKLVEESDGKPAPPPVPTDASPATRIIEIRERRFGPEIIKYGCYAGAVGVAYTYASGFWLLFMRKDRPGWMNTFRQRTILLAPVLTLYACGNGIIPMPFQRTIERLVGRPALSTMDIYNAREYMKKHGGRVET